ncbi:LON peptidase substrate-binding domain-containing protein [Noviherbaspirillum massiliense]|uniref:LON peptidase substrate-binding domain-containing protein n=1 Tax=Noviherbaspirillum massiliense TaxID=1465823 RepID=UPI00031C23AF|nr:LON peptidase substrate-binding domain-containing protein [Noviherbaspirillum massiliense]
MTDNQTWIPLFPLKTVLFPGGILPLKVIEARYIEMVRNCLKDEVPFGVALVKQGQDAGVSAEPEAVGCLAHIEQDKMAESGTISLRTRGGRRFRILETRLLADQRLEARIESLAEDVPVPASTIHVNCAKALKAIIDNITAKGRAEQGQAFVSPFAEPFRFDSAGWVANRWCEILPIPLKARQKLLELDDAGTRLSIIHQYLQQHKIL